MSAAETMPVIFIGHGNPMNVLQDNVFTRDWERIGRELPRPKAILSISAHWITPGRTLVHVGEKPKTIYDFGRFPDEMYNQEYSAPGSPSIARETIASVESVAIGEDTEWGFDHGTWTVLKRMFPDADIPTYQLSIDYAKPPLYHYEIAKELRRLRSNGVLILGSGNVTHNLGSVFGSGSGSGTDWAQEFDSRVKSDLDDSNDRDLIEFLEWGSLSRQAHPSHDHFLPMIYCIGLRDKVDTLSYFAEGFDMGTLSMRSFVLGSNR